MDLDNWMLFDLRNDPFETRDLARTHPDRLAALVAAFDRDAQANHVYPLDNRGVRRSLTVPPFLEASVSEPRTFHPDAGTAALSVVAPMVADRDFALTCAFGYRTGDAGVLFALGDPIAGVALYVRDGALRFAYHGGQGRAVTAERLPVAAGTNRFVLDYRALGARRGRGTLSVNGDAVATLDLSPTIILGLGVGEGLDVGCDRKLHVTPDYGGTGTCAYTGRVEHVRIVPGAHPADSYANRPERLAPRE
jgi:arylsulfatase